MDFQIGQRVKVVGNERDLAQIGAGGTSDKAGIIVEIGTPDDFGLSHLVKIDDNDSVFWYSEAHLEFMPDAPTPIFKVGQRVKTGDSVVTAPNCIGEVVKIGDDNVCLNMPGYGDVWYESQHLELITEAPTPEVKQYPPLRVMVTASQPSQTWQQVLAGKPLAASQPHLYLLGEYQLVSHGDLPVLAFKDYVLMNTQADSEGNFLIFMIDEEL